MMTLFQAPRSTSFRLVWLLEELEVAQEVDEFDIRRIPGSGATDRTTPRSDGRVPALIHDGAELTEPAAMALYLTDRFPEAGLGAPVGSRDRARYLSWLSWSASEMEPALRDRLTGAGAKDPFGQFRYDEATARLLDALWDGPWLMGQRFTAIDVVVGAAVGQGRAALPDSPLFGPYLERLARRPAYVRALARDSDGAFSTAA